MRPPAAGAPAVNHPPGIADTDRALFPDPVDRTSVRMESLRRQITFHVEAHGSVPKRLDDATGPESDWVMDFRHDAWGHEFKYSPSHKDYTLASAGPDGRFGTADDIVVSRDQGTRWR